MTDKQDPIAHAARLLREAAEELRQAHAYSNSEGWENETDAKAAYDDHLAAAQALEDWEAAVGAGGVNGPLMGQPQAMPDLTALTERGAKAWTAADAQALREGRWYMVTHDGVATLCEDRRDAEKEAKDADMAWPHSGPHRAVQLVEASTAGFTAADMATASAQGFRDGVASLSANAGEPVAWQYRSLRDNGAADLPAIISGALFDFAGFLTTLDKSRAVTFSGAHEAGPAVTLLQEWSTKRGLNLDEADVSGWHSALTAQALSAAPAIAKLRHLYQNMVNGAVRDTASAKRIAEGLLAPAIEALERATPPAEQQVASSAVLKAIHEANMQLVRTGDDAFMLVPYKVATVEQQAAPKAAPGVGNSVFDHQTAADFLSGKTVSDEAVRKFVAASRWAHDERAALSAKLLAMHGVLASLEAEIALLKKALMEAEAAPQPAPAPLSDDAKDAARWRMVALIGDEVMLPPEKRTQAAAVKAYVDATHSGLDMTGAVDAALAAQGGKDA